MKRNKQKSNSGITLIALVVTIIVLLILAGISINMITGDNSLIQKTIDAKTKTSEAEIREKIQLAEMAAMVNESATINYQALKAALAREFGTKGTDWDISDEEENPWVVTVGEVIYNVEHTTGKTAKFIDGLGGKTHVRDYGGLTKIERASTIPQTYENEDYIVSTEDSDYPIYMWKDGYTLYWYSEFKHPKLPANCSYLFAGFSCLINADGILDWDASGVTDFGAMFNKCYDLVELNLSKWKASPVGDMSVMFSECHDLRKLDLSGWNTSNVTNMGQMFYNCDQLDELNLSGWSTSNVTDMSAMFYNCRSLDELDLSEWDTSNVTNFEAMFCMELGNSKLRKIIASNSFTTNGATKHGGMFWKCTSLIGGNGTIYDSTKTDGSMAHIDVAENPGYFTSIEQNN